MAQELVTCQRCRGAGTTGGRPCGACRGQGQALLVGGYIVHWQKPLTQLEFLQDHLQIVTRSAIRLILFLFSFTGVVYFMAIFIGALELSQGNPLQSITSNSVVPLFLWLSVMAGLHTYYSLDRDIASMEKIPRRVYQTAELIKPQVVDLSAWPSLNVYDTLTAEAREVLARAYRLSEQLHQPFGPVHLFLILLMQERVRAVLARLGVGAYELSRKTIRILASPSAQYSPPSFEAIFLKAYQHAYHDRRLYVDTQFVFEAVSSLDALASEVLYDVGIDATKIDNVVRWQHTDEHMRQHWRQFRARARLRPRHRLDRAMTAVATPILDYFSQDDTELAQWGYFLTTIARPGIIESVLRVLEGGRAALLVGQPGVGKRGIIESIAERMVANDVPELMQDKRLVSVSIPKLVSGATPAEAEGRLLELLAEVARARNIILVIEDIDGMVGITSGREGSVDLANVLARSLSDRRYLCLATTTSENYRQRIESSALASVCTRVELPEPTTNESIQIVETRLGPVEARHRVFFSYDAVVRLVELTAKYIPDRYLPQKALAYINELALYVKQRRGAGSIILSSDVNDFIGERLNIPVSRVGAEESSRLLNMETLIHERVVGQHEAVSAVAEALRRSRAEIGDKKRPIVSLLFLGPTGVGKTELAKAVAEVYFGGENQIVRLDMSEYRELSGLSRLLGSSDGKSRGLLTSSIRAKPFSLLLLDEFEKAHSDVVNIFLQVMDDGRLTDSRGQTTDFTNVILIATSNAGSIFIQDSLRIGRSIVDIEHGLLNTELQQYFRPELLNRFDRIVVFHPLNPEQVLAITKLMLNKLTRRLAEQGIAFQATEEAIGELARAGWHPTFGARPLRRVIQDRVDSLIAKNILEGKLQRRDTVALDSRGRLVITKGRVL